MPLNITIKCQTLRRLRAVFVVLIVNSLIGQVVQELDQLFVVIVDGDETKKVRGSHPAILVEILGVRRFLRKPLGRESHSVLLHLPRVGLENNAEAGFESASPEAVHEQEDAGVLSDFLVEDAVQSVNPKNQNLGKDRIVNITLVLHSYKGSFGFWNSFHQMMLLYVYIKYCTQKELCWLITHINV